MFQISERVFHGESADEATRSPLVVDNGAKAWPQGHGSGEVRQGREIVVRVTPTLRDIAIQREKEMVCAVRFRF